MNHQEILVKTLEDLGLVSKNERGIRIEYGAHEELVVTVKKIARVSYEKYKIGTPLTIPRR